MILAAICGRICVPGGNVIKGGLMPLGSHTDDNDPKTWRTVTSDIPAVIGTFPPNVLPEEILGEHPERPRALLVCGSNPLRSFADTTAYEKAFAKLDLVVTVEIAMTETAALSHYVLPARSAFESWDGTFFPLTFPEIYFSMRRPVVKPEGERLECGQIETRIAKAAGSVPKIPDYLLHAAQNEDLFGYTMALLSFMQKNPKNMKSTPFILAETLGTCYDSAHLAALWGIMIAMPKSGRKNAERAGFAMGTWLDALKPPERIARAVKAALKYQSYAPFMALSPEIRQSENIFNAILKHPEGLWVGKLDAENNMKELRTEDGKIHLHIADVEGRVKGIHAESERKSLLPNPDYPFILNAGRHSRRVANTLMRDPAWLESKRGCSAAIHPDDALSLGIKDRDTVRVTTEAGSEETEAEVTLDVRKGQVLIPHGFGLVYQGKKFGANVNRLTKNTHRDPLGTPLHRYVPCRIEKI
jgi:anaerobic selenocysteine-containing dehydrogenase